MRSKLLIVIVIFLTAVIASILTAFVILNSSWSVDASADTVIKDFYDTEYAVMVSPHAIKNSIDKNDGKYLVIDLRTAEEYKDLHIKGAINMPLDPSKNPEEVVKFFNDLPKDKEIVLHCYNIACTKAVKIGKFLSDNGIYVKHLGIGWYEWKHEPKRWISESEWEGFNISNYMESNNQGTTGAVQPCSTSEDFGC